MAQPRRTKPAIPCCKEDHRETGNEWDGGLANLQHRLRAVVSAGKENGLGLRIALSRQTVLDHGGDI